VPIPTRSDMVDALKVAGATLSLRLSGRGHDSWTETYNNPDLFTWFLQHRRLNRKNNRSDLLPEQRRADSAPAGRKGDSVV